MPNKTIVDLKIDVPKDLKVVCLGDPSYLLATQISNSRFGHLPGGIAYCKNVEHVKICIDFCRTNSIPFRVRSGGHHHEGMCSANHVLVIDLSKIDTIEYLDNGKAWIPVGKQLQTVYKELEEKKTAIIPGGSCQSVNIGGITHGGGWGVSVRKFGFTSDNIVEAEMVLANGEIVYASENNYPDLFWGLRGGGGGNFGVVTRFKFKLSPLGDVVSSFALLWEESEGKSSEQIKMVLKKWAAMQTADTVTKDLSTACSLILSAPIKDSNRRSSLSVRMGGMFYGKKDDLLAVLKENFGDLIPDEKEFVRLREKRYDGLTPRGGDFSSDGKPFSLANAQMIVANFLNPSVNEILDRNDYKILARAPSSTCDRPHPHKVSSGFPKEYTKVENDKLIDRIYDYFANTTYYSDVNRYMSFHCLGGVVNVEDNDKKRVFPYADKPYILKFQCWWDNSGNAFTDLSRNQEYVQWVNDFRAHLIPNLEGAYINFIDKNLVKKPNTKAGRLELLTMYYGKENLKKLRAIKSEYDEENLFNFGMSVPLAD